MRMQSFHLKFLFLLRILNHKLRRSYFQKHLGLLTIWSRNMKHVDMSMSSCIKSTLCAPLVRTMLASRIFSEDQICAGQKQFQTYLDPLFKQKKTDPEQKKNIHNSDCKRTKADSWWKNERNSLTILTMRIKGPGSPSRTLSCPGPLGQPVIRRGSRIWPRCSCHLTS